MKTHDKLLNTDELRLPVRLLSNDELSKEYTRLTGLAVSPPYSLDVGEFLGWRRNLERKVKDARRLNGINK
jgi:hypothetical protein